MKRWLKTLTALFLVLAVAISCVPPVYADDGWGSYGDNIKWHFYEATGLLQVDGEGEMPDASYRDKTPWWSYANSIKKIEISEGITRVGEYAFADEVNMTSVKLPSTLQSIGRYAFKSTGLTSLKFPEADIKLEYHCFAFCERLKKLVVPGTMKEIGEFEGCKSLTSVTLKEGVEKISDSAFWGCAFTEITLPSSLTTIGKSAFTRCDYLDHLTVPATVQEVGFSFASSCKMLRWVDFEAPCALPESAFFNCSALKAVKLGDGVTSIGYFSFNDNDALTDLLVPASVTQIDKNAFYNKTGNVTFYGYTDTAGYDFAGMNQFVSFVDVAAQGMNKWETAWKNAQKKKETTETTAKKMSFQSVSAKKGAKKITGTLSVSGAVVKVKVGNAGYKKAAVSGRNFTYKMSGKLKKGAIVKIRVTKNGYKTLEKQIKVK